MFTYILSAVFLNSLPAVRASGAMVRARAEPGAMMRAGAESGAAADTGATKWAEKHMMMASVTTGK